MKISLLLVSISLLPLSITFAAEWNVEGDHPVIGAHYMPWFANPHTATEKGAGHEWKHWNWKSAGIEKNPESIDAEGRRDIAAVHYPLIGPYHSLDDSVISYHMKTAKAVGIQALFIIWYGPDTYSDQVIPLLLDQAHREGLKIALCYEEKVNWPPYRSPTSREELVASASSDLSWIVGRFGYHPAYLRREGRPFVFMFNHYGDDSLGNTNLEPDEWQSILKGLPRPIAFARQNRQDKFHPPVHGRYLWWSKDNAMIRDFSYSSRKLISERRMDFFMSMITPGFDDSGVDGWGNGTRFTDGNGISMFRATFNLAWENDPELIQLVTWNDFNEGTVIEPTVEDGFRFLDALETWLGEKIERPVDLEDNRIPFFDYLQHANKAQKRELPSNAEVIAQTPSDLVVEDPAFLKESTDEGI